MVKHPVTTKKATAKVARVKAEVLPSSFVADIRQLVASARQTAYSAVSMVMLDAYWKIGRRIVEEELKREIESQKAMFLLQHPEKGKMENE